MLACLMYRTEPATGAARFYRVEVGYTLFGDYSVVREWGTKGRSGQSRIRLFGNLREASMAADVWRETAQKRGYQQADGVSVSGV